MSVYKFIKMEQIQINRYKNGKIYKIVCNVTGKVYIGSTCLPTLAKRLAQHRKDYKKYLEQKQNYMTSYEIIQNGNYSIFLLEECKCETKDQLVVRERFYVESIECINKNIPGRTRQEYREATKEHISEYNKKYREANRERLMKQIICECGETYTYCYKSTHFKTQKHLNYLDNIKNSMIN